MWDFWCVFFSHGFFLATCLLWPALWIERDIVDWWILTPMSAKEPYRSFKVIVGFTTTSWTSFLLAPLLSLGEQLDLGGVWVVWCVFHFLMMDFTVLERIMSDWNLLVTLSWTVLLHFVWLLWKSPWSSWLRCWLTKWVAAENSVDTWGRLIFKLNHWLHVGETGCLINPRSLQEQIISSQNSANFIFFSVNLTWSHFICIFFCFITLE